MFFGGCFDKKIHYLPCYIFRHIRINYQHSIIILQETHSLSNMEYSWRCEWSGQIFFAHGSESGQGGVAMLFPVNFPCTPCKLYGDENGRVICAKVETRAERDAIFIMGVYGPSIENQNDKCKFLDQVRELMACYETNNMCLAETLTLSLVNWIQTTALTIAQERAGNCKTSSLSSHWRMHGVISTLQCAGTLGVDRILNSSRALIIFSLVLIS